MDDLFVLFGVDKTREEMQLAIQSLAVVTEIDEDLLQRLIVNRVEKISDIKNNKTIQDDKDDLVAHLILRALAASDETERIQTWFINSEGIVLSKKLTQLDKPDIPKIFGKILGTEVLYLSDYMFYYPKEGEELIRSIGIIISDEFLVIDWRFIPRIIRRIKDSEGDNIFLYKGLVVVPKYNRLLISQATSNYRLLLASKIETVANELTVEKGNYYKKLADKITTNVQTTSTSFFGIEHIEKEMEYFPLCMKAIDAMISNNQVPGHVENLQLGFFLHTAGMTFHDFQRYWYLRHPSNREKSWEEFRMSHWGGYVLKQIYNKGYTSYSCKTIHEDGFCPFKDMTIKNLESLLRSYLEQRYSGKEEEIILDDLITQIKRLSRKRYYGSACAREYCLRFRVQSKKTVSSPYHSYYSVAKSFVKTHNRIIRRTKKANETTTE